MGMNYTSLLASKGTSGAISTWAAYNNLDTGTVLTEAQALIFQSLRVREMRSLFTFGASVGQTSVPLPTRFLDPVGRIIDSQGNYYSQKIETSVIASRTYQPVTGGNLASNPITSGAQNTSQFNVTIANHGLTQNSDVTLAGLTSPVDGITVNGTFGVIAIVDANTITCEAQNDDQAATGNQTGGGSAGTWSGNALTSSIPSIWSIFDEAIQFDCALQSAMQARLLCFRSPMPLSAANPTNFLTNRYPTIIRCACQASAAAYMKDDDEEQKWLGKLSKLIDATNAESDLSYRGASIGTDTPGGGYYLDGGAL